MPEGEASNFELEQESKPTLSDEEIAFLKSKLQRIDKTEKGKDFSIANKTIAEANWFFGHPEFGMQEEKSSKFLAKRLSEVLGQENVGEMGGGVYGILEGSKKDGATIFLRGDMDALPLSKDEPAHMCGHNIHMAWLIENARLLSAYKENFSELPFKKIVFIGEPNEEGIVSPEFGPQEMIKAGLVEKTGQPDFILGAHFAAPQVEGTVRIDKDTALYSDGRFHYSLIPRDENQDVKMLEYEFIYQVGKKWQSEEPNPNFGHRLLVDNCQQVIPETIARVTDSKLVIEERRLRPNSLSSQEEAELNLQGSLKKEELEANIRNIKDKWGDEVDINTELNNSSLKITIKSSGGHVAQGGPNVKYIMAELLHYLKENNTFSIQDGNKAVEITGSLRTKAKNWQEEGNKIGEKLQEIANGVITEANANVEIQGALPVIDNPPVYNDDHLRESALNILQKAGIEITNAGIPAAVAETFAFWESELNIPGLYVAIGGGDKIELEDVKEKKLPVPEKYLHHTPAILDLIHTNRAIPYGAVLSLISLELGKQFKK